MRTSDEAYFRTCVAQERRLAHLLGHHNIEELHDSAGVLWEGNQALPKWTRCWEACGPLIPRYKLNITYGRDAEDHTITVGHAIVHCSEQPSPDHALRHAIVKAVIHLLEHAHHKPNQ
ncbi:aminoacyl-tRNA synthetase [uncultured Oxalicibacterium sp.]|uniref:aminoacyl-tRNA synthetase n=1 Tax=uncultured Oxalicibacterium sp. TaxID=1168540 RepID=UPI0025EAA475|nr:aminoacyl-tRNA synthetase [uncultured Oxalicibacterium sp.]